MSSLRRGIVSMLAVVLFLTTAMPAMAAEGPVFTTPSAGNTASPMGMRWPIAVGGSFVPLPMDCAGEKRVLWYGPGTAPDALWRNVTFPDVGASTHTSVALSVGGSFKPFTGDFNGDGCEDVFWYTPGLGADVVWYFTRTGAHVSSVVTANDVATPVVGRFNVDSRDDVFWYVPGVGRESIWLGNANRTFAAAVAPQMPAAVTPVLAVDASSILWYGPGAGPDALWRGVRAGLTKPTSAAGLAIGGSFTVRSFGGQALFYAPGAGADHLVTGVTAAPVKLKLVSGAITPTYVVSSSTARAGFGVLFAPGAGVDYLVKPTQLPPPDTDGDGIADFLDPCPNYADATGACAFTPYQVGNSSVSIGTKAVLANLLVTHVTADQSTAWAQVMPGDAAYDAIVGPDFSAIQIDLAGVATKPARGSRITVAGTTTASRTLTATSLSVTSSGEPPAPYPVSSDASPTTLAHMDGVLVNVTGHAISTSTAHDFTLAYANLSLSVEDAFGVSLAAAITRGSVDGVVGILRVATDGVSTVVGLRPRADADLQVSAPPVVSVAGNGLVEAGEQCDDGDQVNGNGCSNFATIESGFVCSSQPSVCTSSSALVVNEVDYDNVGTDTAEFVEIRNISGSAVSMAGKSLVLVNGAASSAYTTVDLSSAGSLPAGGYLVIGPSGLVVAGGAAFVAFATNTDVIQNGAPDGVVLRDDTAGTVIDSLSYEGSITGATLSGVLAFFSLVEGAALPVLTADSAAADGSLARLPDGSDTNDAATDWTFTSTPTPGAANA